MPTRFSTAIPFYARTTNDVQDLASCFVAEKL